MTRGRRLRPRPGAPARGKEEEGEDGAALASRLASALEDLKARQISVLDIRGLTDVADFLVIATGLSERQLAAMAGSLARAVEEAGRQLLGIDGTGSSGWIVVDTGDVVTHLLTSAARDYYDLDGLWADAKAVHHGGSRGKEAR